MNRDEEARLTEYLAKLLADGGSCRIVARGRIAMGQSRAMHRLEVECRRPGVEEVERYRILVRVEQWGLLGSDSRDEVRVMQALHAAGFPCAKVYAYETSHDILGQPFFVMEELPGTSGPAPETIDDYVRLLERLHQVDWQAAGLDSFLAVPEGPRGSALEQTERWYGIYRWGLVGEPSPLVEAAHAWLRKNAPETARVTVVHGDPGPGNYLHHEGRVVAAVDWEFTHLGDPEEDWAYLIAMRGAAVMPEEDWVRKIRAITGTVLDAERLRYWKCLNFFKGICIDQTAMKLYMDGTNPAPNMLAIGTGVHLSALKRFCDTAWGPPEG
ncbi:MAG: phosphotransferase family protein [Dehalococcoidia bacterium]|nr:phosphotransferase family protein [Dehalococcoidia bacterium]